LGRVAGANADGGFVERDTATAGHVGNAGEGGAEVAFHVDSQGFEGGNVEDSAAWFRTFWSRVEHEAVEAPEESSEGLAGAGWGKDEGAFAAGDDGPAETLGGRRSIKYSTKPFGSDRVKAGKRVGDAFRGRQGCAGSLRRVLRI